MDTEKGMHATEDTLLRLAEKRKKRKMVFTSYTCQSIRASGLLRGV